MTPEQIAALNAVGYRQSPLSDGTLVWQRFDGETWKRADPAEIEQAVSEAFAPAYGSAGMGRPGMAMQAEDQGWNPNAPAAQRYVVQDGKTWMRPGDLSQSYPEVQAMYDALPADARRNDSTYGNLIEQGAYAPIDEFLKQKHEGSPYDFIADAIGFGSVAPFIGGAFPGMDPITGMSIPAGQSSLLSQLGFQNPFSTPNAPNVPSGLSRMNLADLATGTMSDVSGGIGMVEGAAVPEIGASGFNAFDIPGSGLMDFSSAASGLGSGIAGSTPGLSLSALALPSGVSLAPGAGLAVGGAGAAGGGVLSGLSSFLTPKNLLNAGGQLASSLFQNNAVGKAVDAQTGAADRATAATLSMYNQNRADLEPWRTAGSGAVGRLSSMLTPGNQFTAMQADPGYQFRLDEGTKAIDRSAAARGKLFSPGTQNAVQRYGQNFASNEFGNVANRLSNLAGLGQTATNTTAALGANAANQQGQNIIGAGNARASGYVGSANAFGQGLSSFLRGMQEDEIMKLVLGGRY